MKGSEGREFNTSALEEHVCATTAKLIEAIISQLYKKEEIVKICEKLIKSMPKEVSEVIKNRGGHINCK